jgi:hypothetical protein
LGRAPLCVVPIGSGCGGQLSIRSPRDGREAIVPGPGQIGQPHPRQPFPRLSDCTGCGWVCAAVLLGHRTMSTREPCACVVKGAMELRLRL